AIDGWLRDGLEQAIDTVVPEVALRSRLKPFVEDELPAIAANTRGVIAHPAAAAQLAPAGSEPVTLAIGPEGGFSDYELRLFDGAGFTSASLGSRVLRVETALPVLVANLFPACR
ncbi:MAG: RsmE family RNA methyltransferase, partial [Pseudomonadales bacterium]|nr:RsmE family RNA methyltransferase [Pseudomonadales bacterium]